MNLTDIEIGDPKMDSGCLEEGEDLEDDYDFDEPLSPSQVFAIMVHLIYREVRSNPSFSSFTDSRLR
jgi:Mak10 subunit, NatC N(alpha)-terminal acetyltransferase